ncbi:hypothetical protein GCM10009799_45190 [Nocardiopsis rhodophaea]|uniref:Uncharacterized protein n=1 Tax=Nocardiopsis rhodophaea TaxID=280238 RepID=A0ABP5EYP1_9ACTN
MTDGIRAMSIAWVSGEWVTDIGTSEDERHLPATLHQDHESDKPSNPAFTLLSSYRPSSSTSPPVRKRDGEGDPGPDRHEKRGAPRQGRPSAGDPVVPAGMSV